jgi:outer membrane protein insertion porin family/translocation and assembly module TamA
MARGLQLSRTTMGIVRSGRSFWRALPLLLLVMSMSSCATVPGQRYTLDSLTLRGNEDLDDDEIEEKIATRESERFMGVFRGVIHEYQIFDRHVLERDLQRIERYYRSRGYYRARVRAGRVRYVGDRGTEVEILIEEGPLVSVARVDVHGLDALPPELAAEAREAAASQLAVGAPFDEERFEEGAKAVRHALADVGYATAVVERSANVDLPRNRASVGYWVDAGSRMRIGEIRIEGLGEVPEAPVRRALALEPGEPYSETEIEEAERALLDLGAFSSVVVEPELGQEREPGARPSDGARVRPGSDVVPIRVRVTPAKFRSVRLGGGAELDAIRTEIHALAGYENRNLFGGLRRFLVEARPGVVLYPTRMPTFEPPERLLPQGRLRTEFRQPGFPASRTNLLLRGELSAYPVLLSAETDDGAPILGYRDYRASVGLEGTYRRVYGMVSHNLQINRPFTYLGALDPDLDLVIVSYPQVLVALDKRDNPMATRSGYYLALTTQLAGAGGDARDLKLNPDARVYVPIRRKLTLALRASTGFLFPDNYGDTLASNAFTGSPGPYSRRTWIRDIQLLFLRGFFAGGPGSNRGYASREIGPHGVVPFYNPGQSSEAVSDECSSQGLARCDLPLGGLTSWNASVELRYPISGPLSGAVFTDAADVSPYRADLRLHRPHLSAGAGLRYDTPVGPVRLDAGYRIPGLQSESSPDEGVPAELLGLPVALSLGIGESF